MANANQMATALLTEHFRYTPLTLLDDIINTVNELVFRAVNAIETGLSDASAASLGFSLSEDEHRDLSVSERSAALQSAKETEIATGVVQLESLLNATIDKDFDKFEIYTLRNILAVGREEECLAPWVRLEHYRDVQLKPPDEQTPEHVQLARQKLNETSKLNALLRAEEARNAAIIEQLHGLLGPSVSTAADDARSGSSKANGNRDAPLAFLTASPGRVPSLSSTEPQQQQQQQQPLTDGVGSALKQLPALRALQAQLKDSLAALPQLQKAARRDAGDDADGRRQRYVEARARKALERRGLRGEDGMAATLAGSGRRIGKDELRGLEAVLKELGADVTQTAKQSGDDAMDVDG